MRAAPRLAFAVVFVSLAWTTVPRLGESVGEAMRLGRLSREERRAKIFGPVYESIVSIDQSVPQREPLALLPAEPSAIDAALFANYYLYPHRTRLYSELVWYRADADRPRRIVRFEPGGGDARLMSYEAVRAEEIAADPIVTALTLPAESAASFVVPLVTSADGPVPDMYATEAVMENAGARHVRVRLQMFPSGGVAEISLRPGERRVWRDFVYQTFQRMDTGWLQVDSDQPLRARFWWTDRVRRDAEPIPFAEFFRSAYLVVPRPGRLWVLNPYARPLPIRLNGGKHVLQPRTLIPLEWVGGAAVDADDEWYAFVSVRDEAKTSEFFWPEAQ